MYVKAPSSSAQSRRPPGHLSVPQDEFGSGVFPSGLSFLPPASAGRWSSTSQQRKTSFTDFQNKLFVSLFFQFFAVTHIWLFLRFCLFDYTHYLTQQFQHVHAFAAFDFSLDQLTSHSLLLVTLLWNESNDYPVGTGFSFAASGVHIYRVWDKERNTATPWSHLSIADKKL